MNYETRADLMQHPAFVDLDTDSCGNPCIWENLYFDAGNDWRSTWSCQCDDDGVEPYESNFLPGQEFYDLWNSLPEALDAAQRHQREQEALTGSESWITPTTPFIAFQPRERNTILAALRYWQRLGLGGPTKPEGIFEWPIAADGDVVPLSPEEIDTLCERLN